METVLTPTTDKPILGAISEWIRGISRPVKVSVITAFIVGFITHIAAITGLLVNWDSVWMVKFDLLYLVQQGKWLAPLFTFLRGPVQAGSLEQPLAIIILAISAGLITSILKIRSPISGGLIGAVLVTMPSLMCTASYSSEDYFAAAVFLAVLAVYLVERVKLGFIYGTVALAFSLGAYQAYIGFSAGLFVLLCFFSAMQNEDKPKSILLRGCKYIGILAVAIALYYIILKLVLSYTESGLSDYRSINQMGRIDLKALPTIIVKSYKAVVVFMLKDQYGFGRLSFTRLGDLLVWQNVRGMQQYWCGISYVLTMLVSAFLWLWLCIRNGLFKKGSCTNLVIGICMILILPLAVHAVGILGQNSDTSWIMKYPFVVLFFVPIKLADMCDGKLVSAGVRSKRFLIVAATAISCATVFNWFVVTNNGYTALTFAYEGAYNTCVQIADDVAETDGYAPGMPVYIAGRPDEDNTDTFAEFDGRYTGITDRNFLFNYNEDGIVKSMLKQYLGVQYYDPDPTKAAEVIKSQTFQDMPGYPQPGYIRIIDDIVFVKTGPNIG